ncbi:protein delta homolog 1 [Danio rerio]|uniref:Protein delta homolog 1 n=1 Tax=Danio rerio TaxID=7955 RepID=A0A8M2BKT5_DANRE
MSVFLRLGFCFLLLFCCAAAQGPDCGAGCHRHHGFCEQSGECRCKSGWRGAVCDQCVPSADCVHGWCESPGECICESGWSGARCDRDVRPCSSQPCSADSRCVDAAGGRGHVCICTATHCRTEETHCTVNGSLCQNGGSCVSSSSSFNTSSSSSNTSSSPSSSSSSFCLCPAGFTGSLCELQSAVCKSSVCVNGGRCVRRGLSYRCVCARRFSGSSCERHRPRVKAPQQHHTALHKPLETPGALASRSQLICFSVLALLTVLVVLGSTAIVFFQRCEVWMANVRYRQLVAQQRELIQDQATVNIILPEKIKLSSYSRHYTSI